ncbi:hypothetical protein JI59_18330 [Novosphingobium pentaromativorans US6-1]|nr:hypothetical protein JI59_18330 [Novosphingobium pentaromativorans US6-1]
MGVGLGAGGVLAIGIMRALGSAARWIIEYFGGRMDKRADRLDASTDKLIKGLEDRIDALTKRLDHVEQELSECKEQHAVAEARNKHLEAMMQGYGDARQRIATEQAAEVLSIRERSK